MLYLDHNATSPPQGDLRTAVQAAWLQALDLANPSSVHAAGQTARQALLAARAEVASLLGARPAEVVFTSGATEANHQALMGAARRSAAGSRLCLSAVEHPGLIAVADELQRQGHDVVRLPVDPDGRLRLPQALAAITPGTALVSVMAANHETGVLQPVSELAAHCRRLGVLLHTDATQALGKTGWEGLHAVDLLSVSAHKIGGPKGVGALVLRGQKTWPALLHGRQERARRGGTENLPGILGFAAACTHLATGLPQRLADVARQRDRLEAALQCRLGAQVLGQGAARLVNTCTVRLPGLPAERALAALDAAGVMASSGAACQAGGTSPSTVLLAMGLGENAAREGLRFSFGPPLTEPQLCRAIDTICGALAPLRQALPA